MDGNGVRRTGGGVIPPGKEDPSAWIMHFDGSFSRKKGGAGVVLDSPMGDRLKYVIQVLYGENITNNAMEYEGLLGDFVLPLASASTRSSSRVTLSWSSSK